MKKVYGILVVIAIVAGAVLYHPQKIDEPMATDWRHYSNPELGISFSYPPEWGETRYEPTDGRGRDFELSFASDTSVVLLVMGDEKVLKHECARPKIIEDQSYCRLFENGQEYLYEYFSIAGGQLEVSAIIKNFAFVQTFSQSYDLESILDRTASADILEKIDTFEKVMLTLEVK